MRRTLSWARCLTTITLGTLAISCSASNSEEKAPAPATEPATVNLGSLQARLVMSKSSPLVAQTPNGDITRLVVKFNEGTGVRLNGAQLASMMPSSASLSASAGVASAAQLGTELTAANAAFAAASVKLSRLLPQSDAALAALKRTGEARSGRQLAEMSLYYAVDANDFSSLSQMEELRDALNALASVEGAYIEARPEPASIGPVDADAGDAGGEAPPPTPDFTALQTYKGPAPLGVDADFAGTVPGGRGDGVFFVDIEGAWTDTHEDMPTFFFTQGSEFTTPSWFNHGTAVMGVVAGVDNGFGITGIATESTVGWSSVASQSSSGAITAASNAVGPGGVILIELHREGPTTATCTCNTAQCNYLALEHWQADFDAIATASANGVTVIEAAGNGSVNLDDEEYGGNFNRSIRDSGAIVIGGSASTARTPMCWSNNGTRVDVHGWGQNVVTMGYGGLYSGPDGDNDTYTSSFSGTSSGSAMIAGVVTAMQGAATAELGAPLTPLQMRALMSATSTAQTGDLGTLIGGLPNMRAAIETVADGAPIPDFTHSCAIEDCNFTDASSPIIGAVTEWNWDFGDGASATDANPVHQYSGNGIFEVSLTITDADGQSNTLVRNIIVDGSGETCGDGTCSGAEDCSSCPSDCGSCEVCGDGTCDPTEDCSSCQADCGSCGSGSAVWLEAEDGVLSGSPPFNIVNESGASGGAYIDPTSNDLGAPGPNRALYTVNVESGDYILWGRVIAPSGDDDSFWVRVDGGNFIRWNNIAHTSFWAWDEVHDTDNGGNTVTFSLAAGTHTIEIANRENGTRLDKLYLTADGDEPMGEGGGDICGDGVCSGSEDCSSCVSDCGACPDVCGDGVCSGSEDCSSCVSDCGACPDVCGDGVCGGSEDCSSCVSDCGPCPDVCGDGVCGGSEDCSSCESDCGACPDVCGDGVCGGSEDCSSCESDCGQCGGSSAAWLEAEDGVLSGSPTFSIVSESGAAGGAYIAPTSNDLGAPGPNRATYNVELEAGDYILWGRVIAPSGDDDSFWVRVDGGNFIRWNNIAHTSSWAWDEVHDTDNGGNTVTFSLAAGSHTIEIANREDGTLLDKLYLTSNGDEPMGEGGGDVCGDGVCGGSEDCSSCESDCGACPDVCGDGVCGGSEDCSSCESDCGACPDVCGDGVCGGSEDCSSCESDCGACPDVCGDGVCGGSEDCSSCESDCGACPDVCGDGVCGGSEDCSSCESDCGACPDVCGDGVCGGSEDCSSCESDCGACPDVCGDGVCGGSEDCSSCESDCGACPDVCGDGVCGGSEDCSSCESDCGQCQSSCTCPSGCDSVTNQTVPFTRDGVTDICLFFPGSLGNNINNWNNEEVNLNGVDVTNVWTGSSNYPAQIDGGYYLYIKGNFGWSHTEVR